MELDLWNSDLLMFSDWDLETPEVQFSGPVDDLGSTDCLKGSNGVEELPLPEPSVMGALHQDDGLGLEWMESADVGSFLASLTGDLQASGTVESDLQASGTVESDFLQSVDLVATSPPADQPFLDMRGGDYFWSPPVSPTAFTLSPPESPPGSVDSDFVSVCDSPSDSANILASGTITLKVEEDDFIQSNSGIVSNGIDLLSSDAVIFNVEQNDFILAEVCTEDLSSVCGVVAESSPVLSDETSSTISFPSSPDSQNSQSSIIDSSPELYKVICTGPSTDNRYTPYPKPQKKKNTSPKPRKRQPAQPVPEHVIMEQLDKKDRKKLQNKNAAIRYRQKKKEEAVGIVSEEQMLEDVNTKLKTKVDDLEREIRYMKSLMEDVCRAKGIIV